MNKQTLITLVMTGDGNAENECIADYLDTLERICDGIATRFNCDADELISEGYVHLVTIFRALVGECRSITTEKGYEIYGEEAIGSLNERLTSQLKLEIENYALQNTSPKKDSVDAMIGAGMDIPAPMQMQTTSNQNVSKEVSEIPERLLNPFTTIARLCHGLTDTCQPPMVDDKEKFSKLILTISTTYHVSMTDATALLESYTTYVDRILAAHFNDQQQQ